MNQKVREMLNRSGCKRNIYSKQSWRNKQNCQRRERK